MHQFFTTESTEPPAISALWYSVMVLLIVTAIMMSLRYYQNEQFRKCFQYLQGFQLICLYLWYFAYHIPWSNSLPFYHCRLAMLVLLFAPKGTYIKQYFALLGVLGSIAALVYPAFDPFPFPHITVLNLIFSHWALFANSLIYLQDFYQSEKQDNLRIVKITFGMNAVIFLVNLLTRGDYGFLRRPPIIGDHGALLNYLLVSIVMVAGICLVNQRYKYKMVEESIVSRSE